VYNSRSVRLLFIATLFLSAFLLFLVQPLVAKMVLPIYGGAPAVWMVSMVFFQLALLGGYAYAHWSVRALGVRRQRFVHLALFGLAGLTLPFAATGGWRGEASPALSLLMLLASMVGAGFLAVSAGAPLLQRWFAATDDPEGKDPYFLYAASNVGSMLALFVYPVLIEPYFALAAQARIWAGGYALLALGMLACALFVRRAEPATEGERSAPLPIRLKLLWLALAAVPSSLLLGVTSFLTTNVAPVPFLWVVPLALYLLTFVIAFARRRFVTAAQLGRVFGLLAIPLAMIIILESSEPLVWLAALHLIAFFVAALMCHSRLVDLRPESGRLTEFYLWMSAGGVVGGAFTALAAPVLFSTLVEYPLALVGAALLMPAKAEGSARRKDVLYALAVTAVTFATVLLVRRLDLPGAAVIGLALGLPLLLAFLAAERPLRYGLALLGFFIVSIYLGTAIPGQLLHAERSFFGVHRVLSMDDSMHLLTHGNTTHGMQNMANPEVPLTYYHPTGPIGQVFRYFSGPMRKERVGLVGLGVGSLAAYGESGQRMVFFEIDPAVERIARDGRLFRYLADSAAEVEVALGDARLTLQDRNERYGLLVLDAFTSDAVPMHLLTVEAIQLYLERLDNDGLIAFHISNRYLDLAPVLAAAADRLGLATLYQEDLYLDPEDEAEGKRESQWLLMARESAHFGGLADQAEWYQPLRQPRVTAWTDDFSNLLRSFR
jgi:hypothetical protein